MDIYLNASRLGIYPPLLTSPSGDSFIICWNIVHAANREKYSSINRIAISERASLHDVDRHSPYPAIFLSREDEDGVREIRKEDFCSILLHPMLSNATPMLTRPEFVSRHFEASRRDIHHAQFVS